MLNVVESCLKTCQNFVLKVLLEIIAAFYRRIVPLQTVCFLNR